MAMAEVRRRHMARMEARPDSVASRRRIAPMTLAWLAGLLEGEGCFSHGCSPSIKCHPKRRHYALGLCEPCWKRAHRAERKSK